MCWWSAASPPVAAIPGSNAFCGATMLETEVAMTGTRLKVGYELADGFPAGADVLAALCFGAAPPDHDHRWIRVGLQPLRGDRRIEVWRSSDCVVHGHHGPLRFAHDREFLFGSIQIDEREVGGIENAAQRAYAELCDFVAGSQYPHLLRVWNYFDRINHGAGDHERYRLFCIGRARGMRVAVGERLPAATAIGRTDGEPTLQVYWLAARTAGTALENPRQVSAYRYPREYGPVSPSFSRAMLARGQHLLVSGTASVVGHQSRHAGDSLAQLAESLRNLDSIRAAARCAATAPAALLKVYLRNLEDAEAVAEWLRSHRPQPIEPLLLAGDICRSDLLVELDATQCGY